MDGTESQPFSASRQQRPFSDVEESSCEISARDLQNKLKNEKHNRKEVHELYSRLQGDYDDLLTKYAQAENTIDQLRIGARLNLYSDLPPPQQSSFVTVHSEKQPRVFDFPRSRQAVLNQAGNENGRKNSENLYGPHHLGNNRIDHNHHHVDRSTITTNSNPNVGNSDILTPDARAESIRMGLMFQIENLLDDVNALQENLHESNWAEPELREMHEMCRELRGHHAKLGSELSDARRLEGKDALPAGNIGYDGDYLPQDSVEGQLYRIGLRLEEVNEQLNNRLGQASPRRETGDTTNRPRTDSHSGRKEAPSSDIHGLIKKLRQIKESNMKKNEDVFSRSANSLDDVEDLDLNAEGQNDGSSHRDFSLGALPDDSSGDQNSQTQLPEGFDLQESGYFASETMSNCNDMEPSSQPLSSMYFSQSGRPRRVSGLSHESLDQRDDLSSSTLQDTVQRRDSGASGYASPEAPRSRSASHMSRRSRGSTLSNQDPEDVSPFSSPDMPSPVSHTGETSTTPRASSSPLRSDKEGSRSPVTRNRQDSRLSDASAGTRRTRSDTMNSRQPKADILRTDHDRRDSHQGRNRTLSRSHSLQSSPRSPRDPLDKSPDSSPRQSSHQKGQKLPGLQRHSVSSVADSRMSTPLFMPHGNEGARPKDRRTEKYRPPTADTERGFDSGFFGSEGSRISRGLDSPELQPPKYLEVRPRRTREQSVTESEEEHYDSSSLKPPTKTLPRYRERHRRSRLKSLSETDEDRGLDTSLSKASVRTPSSQRERRTRRQVPTHPTYKSDDEPTRTFDDNVTRHSSSPDLYRELLGERTPQRSRLGSSLRSPPVTPSRHDISRKSTAETGPSMSKRASPQDGRPMDKQSMRSYPGMDRESVRSGRRSRRDAESSSGYSDGERKYRRDPLEKLQAEIAKLRGQLHDETGARNMHSRVFDDLRRRHDDIEREMARRNAEQQMTSMYDNLRKKYDDLANTLAAKNQSQSAVASPQSQMLDDLKNRVDELAKELEESKRRRNEGSAAENASGNAVHFPCPLCGGTVVHVHGDYYYPGYIGPHSVVPPRVPTGTARPSEIGTQTGYLGTPGSHVRHPSTPVAASTPYYYNVVGSPVHHHTQTYPGTYPGMASGTPTVHHIHHLPGGSTTVPVGDYSDGYSSEEDDRRYQSRRSRSRLKRNTGRRSRSGYYDNSGGIPDDSRLHLSLDEANRAARDMQRLSKRMLNTIASDLIRSGSSRR